MKKKQKEYSTISQEDLNTFEEINQAFRDDFVEPDSDILELNNPVRGKIKGKHLERAQQSGESTIDTLHTEQLVKKHVEQWLTKNVPTIMRQILNSKIDEMKDAE